METEREPDIRSMWGAENGARPAANPVNEPLFAQIHIDVAADIDVAPEQVWNLVTDPTRIGEFSPECVRGRWIEGSDRPEVGARFEGTNRSTLPDSRNFEWVRPCTVTRAEPHSLYAYVAHDRWDQPATEWTIRIERTGAGCRVTQSMRVVPGGLSGLRLAADADPSIARDLVDDRVPHLRQGMAETLGRMKTHLER